MLDLFWHILLAGLLLLGLGAGFLLDRAGWRRALEAFPRSETAAYVTMGLGGAWFLYKMYFLGPEDNLFGPKTNLVFVAVFGAGWIGSFVVLKEFLAVRGLVALALMASFFALTAGQTHYEAGVLFFKAMVYLVIVASIYLGVAPYRLRDLLAWLHRSTQRPKVAGGVLAGVGLVLSLVAFSAP
ncbi:MAG: hypothetical protein ACLFR7_12280 [Opitutales bacterium]